MHTSQRPYQSRRQDFVRRAIAVFLLLTCVRVWLGPEPIVGPARAQIPDSGLQRKLLLAEAERTNGLLTDIKRLLETGTLNVRIQGADNQADTATVLPRPGN